MSREPALEHELKMSMHETELKTIIGRKVYKVL